jgi:ribonuclease J
MVKEPIVLSRGFVFVKENTDLINYLKDEAKLKFKENSGTPSNFEYIKDQIQSHVETVIYEKTGRQPMVLPLIIEVE